MPSPATRRGLLRFENEELPAKGTDNVKEDVNSKTGAFDAKIEFTDHVNEDEVQNVAAVAVDQGENMMDKEEIINDSESEEDEEETYEDRKVDTKKKWWFSSMFQR
nr:signal recognition particle receptor subunit alpha-like [Ipomoea batatas]